MFNKQTISRPALQKGHLKTYLFDVKIPRIINKSTIQSCELSIDSHDVCTLYIQYHEDLVQYRHQLKNVAGLDLGVSKIATIGFDTTYRPLTYDGRLLRSINKGYNRLIAKAKQKKFPRKGIKTSEKLGERMGIDISTIKYKSLGLK